MSLEANRGAQLFTLRNGRGLVVAITNYGGSVVALQVPDRHGHLADVVLGFGGHAEPVQEIARVTAQFKDHDKSLIASVTGTELDPQNLGRQMRALQAAGFLVTGSMSDAAGAAANAVGIKV